MVLYYGNVILCIGAAYGFKVVNPKFELTRHSMLVSAPFFIGFAKGIIGLIRDLKYHIADQAEFVNLHDLMESSSQSLALAWLNSYILVSKYEFPQLIGLILLILGMIPPIHRYITKLNKYVHDTAVILQLLISLFVAATHSCYYGLAGTGCFIFATFPTLFIGSTLNIDPTEVGSAVCGVGYVIFAYCLKASIRYNPFWK